MKIVVRGHDQEKDTWRHFPEKVMNGEDYTIVPVDGQHACNSYGVFSSRKALVEQGKFNPFNGE